MIHDFDEFYKLATEKFGADKFTLKDIQATDENLIIFNEKTGSNITKDDLKNYHAVWILENKCPNCGEELLGLFGSFEWGIEHGCGYCSKCNETTFRYYHYIGGSHTPIKAMALIGF